MKTARKPGPSDHELLERALERERKARQRAEDLLETMSSNIYDANEKLRGQFLELDYINQVSAIAEAEAEVKTAKAVQRFLELSVAMLGWPLGHVYFASQGEDGLLSSSAIWAGDTSERFAEFKCVTEKSVLKPGEGIPGRVAVRNEVVWVEDLVSDKNFPRAKLTRGFNLTTGFGVPLSLQGKVLAVFEFFHTERRVEDEHKAEVIHTALKQLARLLERKKAQRELASNFKKLNQAKEQLVQSEKMASLGIISAGVAHEINNPLSYILANLETLKGHIGRLSQYDTSMLELIQNPTEDACERAKELRKDSDLDYVMKDLLALAEETLAGAFRVRDIVRGLRSFSHMDRGQEGTVDLIECIQSVTRILSNEIKYRCDLELDLKPIPPIHGYSGQIIQVFTNLILNSMQAMEERRGVIKIATFVGSEGEVHASVRDNGKGISPAHLKQIFTPFFTTKPTGKGTGLGLSISYGIVKAHGGEIHVRSELGVGTEFELVFDLERSSGVEESMEGEFEW